MYTAFYGLREKPFALVPDPRYLFLAESHREALAHLLYGIDQAEGFIAVTGEVGTGKTTICRTLLGRLGSDTEFAFLFNPSPSGVELLQDICGEFGIPCDGLSRSDLSAELNRFLLKKKQENRRVLLIVDEAQNLSDSTLEQVRLLSNLETSSQKLIQILLLGQPELDRKLDSPELRQLRQRISVRWGLHALTARETRAYVKHRLHVAAGAERDIFTDGALREIHRRSGGVPRLINVLCDRVLLAGYVARASRIGASIVRQAAREIPDTRRRRRFALPAASLEKVKQATGLAARRLGAGAVFGAGLALGLAIAGGLLVGSLDTVREQLRPYLPSFLEEPEDIDVAAQSQPPVSSPPPQTTAAIVKPDAALLGAEIPGEQALASGEPLPPVDSAKIDEMSNVVARELAEGEFLGAALAEEDPDVMCHAALNAILDSFGVDGFEPVPESDDIALAWLEERGLATIPLRAATLQSLRNLNHPVLLRVRASEAADARLIAVLRIDGGLASIYGVSGDRPLWVPIDELLQQWDGEGWAIWHDFESTRPILAYGEQGQSVSWLQQALSELGYFEGKTSGYFDSRTVESVQEFQRRQKLQADGMAGPRTRMILYQLLDRYEVPRLEGDDEEAAG